jgi:molybdopterin biosynthesis enzyme
MNRMADHPQRIDRLTPLSQAFDWIDRCVLPVQPRRMAVERALGRILADDMVIAVATPLRHLSWRDGWGLRSDDTIDAGGYAPAILSATPVRLNVGDPLPDGMDAVAPLDVVDADRQMALAVVGPGEGVLASGADARAGEVLLRAGTQLRLCDLAAVAALGIAEANVRESRICIVAMGDDAIVHAIASFIAGTVAAAGGIAERAGTIEEGADGEADALITVGGTGCGRADASVRRLAAVGAIHIHGIGLMPGETAALGHAGRQPALLVPGRLDAAVAVWLTLGRRIMARLGGASLDESTSPAALTHKITSTLGLAELVLLRRGEDGMTPLATGHLPLAALAAADAYILVPPECEGYPAGTRIHVKALP